MKVMVILMFDDENFEFKFSRVKSHLNPSLHRVVIIAEHSSDDAPKRILRLSTHRMQIFLVKYEYLRSLQPCEYQGIREKLKKRVRNHVLAILTTGMDTQALHSPALDNFQYFILYETV